MKSISTITRQLGTLKGMIVDPKHADNKYLLLELSAVEQALLWVAGGSSSPSKMFKARRVMLDKHDGPEHRIFKPESCLSCGAEVKCERSDRQTIIITFFCGGVVHWQSTVFCAGSSPSLWSEYLLEEYPCPEAARIPCVMSDSNSGSSEPRIDMPGSCLRCGAEVEHECDTGDHTQTVRITFFCGAAANWRAILCSPPGSYEESVYEVRPCRAKLGSPGEQEDG